MIHPSPDASPRIRRVLLYLPGEAIVCAGQHPLAESVVLLPHGLRQCRAAIRHRRGAHCGHWVWVWAHGDGSRTVVDLDEYDQRIIKRGHLSLEQVRDYLGLSRRQVA